MYSELSLLVELYNPLYLFPIFGVVFTALIVYAFGFKSSTQPPTEVFDALNDRHHKNYKTHETLKKKKQNQKITSKTESKNEPNGHISSNSVKPTEKKAPKKAVEPKSSSEPKPKPIAKKTQKNKKTEDLEDKQNNDDYSGEWVELISKKERKNRKQKEEQLLIESVTGKADKSSSDKSPKKSSKKNKTPKNTESNSSPELKSKPTEEIVVKEKNDLNSNKTQNGILSEELVAEEPDIYELAKEQRVPKKSQKHRNQKRNSESETAAKVEQPLEEEPKTNLNLTDKLTASIVANYEGNDKTDSSNTSNNKKKNKKKQTQSGNNSANNDKQVIRNEEKIASIETNGTSNEKSNNSLNVVDISNEIKTSEEEEFKSVGKKRRARRE